MLLLEHRANKEDSDETLDEFLNRKKDEGQLDEVINNGDGTHTVITDGYEFIIDDETLEIIEVAKESWFRHLTRGKAKFVYTIESEYVANVDVGIEIDESVKMYTTQYKIGDDEGAEWKDYTEGETFNVTVNGTIYGRIVNQDTNEVGYEFKSTINKIDTIAPQSATIVFNKKSVDVGGAIQVTVTQEDLETGIVPSKCKWIVDTSASNYGTTSNKWDSATAFTSNPQVGNITKSAVGYYYLHVLSCDEAGNLTETRSEPIYFSGWVTLYSVHASDAFQTNKATFTNSWTGTGSGWSTGSVGANANSENWYWSKFVVDANRYSVLEFTYRLADCVSAGAWCKWGVVSNSGSKTFLTSVTHTEQGNIQKTETVSLTNLTGNVTMGIQIYRW